MSEVPPKCCSCGKFIAHDDMLSGAAHFYFEPDSHKGPEISEWTCKKCNNDVVGISRSDSTEV